MVVAHTKRKKTADMPDSPPKRITRARAAKTTDGEPRKPMTTKIATPSAKAAAQKKKASMPNKVTAPPKATKRKTRADDEVAEPVDESVAEEPVVEVQQPMQPAKAKGRPKKATPAGNEEIQVVEAPKTRTRQPKAPATNNVDFEAPKPRGRPKRVAEPVTVAPNTLAQPEIVVLEPVKKATRGRPVFAATSVTTRIAAPKAKTVPAKKKVKFEEKPAKENMPVETAVPEKSAMKPAGLKAKPVRMPASVRASATRGRNGIQGPMTQEAEKKEALPLSPKKVVQVAKSDPISEDELAGEKAPVRALTRSPAKRPMSPLKDIGTVSKSTFNQLTAPSSPAKTMSSSAFASPARRPPPSPFKDSLKSSPQKLNHGDGIAQPVLLSSRTPLKASLLQESPKRAVFADSAMKPVLLAARSPMKASLLQTPARRPPSSPTKPTARSSPEKPGSMAATTDITASPSKVSPSKAPTFSPEQVISSPLRAARSPEHNYKTHTITDDEQNPEENGDEESTGQLTSAEEQDKEADTASVPQEVGATVEPESLRATDELAESPAPQEAPAVFAAPVFSIGSSSLRRISVESESSEDELASPQKIYEATPLRRCGISTKDFATPAIIEGPNAQAHFDTKLSFTPLANQLSSWNASSPDKQANRPRQARGMFSLGGAEVLPVPDQLPAEVQTLSPAKSSFFDDGMAMHDAQDDISYDEPVVVQPTEVAALHVSQESIGSDEYGDENAMPSDPELLRAEQEADQTLTCTPAKVFTPVKAIQRPLEMHTVSKVPLRPSAEDSPVIPARHRSRSFGGPLAVVSQRRTTEVVHMPSEQPTTPILAPTLTPQTPSSGMRLDAETPGRTVRKGVMPDVLKGAVVYVDVHTTEGADASGIFVDLLTQMGARCVKQWNWNPRAGMGSSIDSTASPQGTSPDVSANKVGITHVVYKDGGKRTLEKVRSSNGVVLCVGVGWVLDCEREDRWLDEVDYAIDTSIVPRGGSRRRKSMEPRALANLNGSLVPANTAETPAKPVEMSPTKEFLTFDTPASRRETFVIDRTPTEVAVDMPAPATPAASSADDNMPEDGSEWGSPTTPYYLSKGTQLVQQTCPSKQMAPMSLFPVSGNVEDQPDETVRKRLLQARRKSLQWSSRIRSPLGRVVSYGKETD